MTRADLASAIDYQQYWIELLEDGIKYPSLHAIEDIANALNVEPSWMLAWRREETK